MEKAVSHPAALAAQIALVDGRPTLLINGQAEYPMFYALTDVPGGRFSWEDVPAHNVRQFSRAGVRLFQFDVAMDHVWMEDGSIDLTVARNQIAGALAARPDAAVVFRLHVRPPRWWVKLHPEENTGYLDAQAQPDYDAGWNRYIEDDLRAVTRTSLGSDVWLRELGPVVARFCRELAATPEGNALIGIQVASGVFGEWHYWSFNTNEVDNGPAMTRHFRNWLCRKYQSDAALQKAWNNPGASLDSVAVPGLEERAQRGDGYFRDPSADRAVMDYYQCQHEAVADAILYFARIVKENWPRPIVTGTFYGYFFACFGRDQAGGHIELQRVLESPYVDYLSAPSAYYPESFEIGDAYRSRGLLATARLHGKLWLDEMDQAIPLKPYFHKEYGSSLQASIAKVRRNVMSSYCQGQGLWFYDFGPSGFAEGPARERIAGLGVVGWWDDPHVLADIRRLRTLLTERAHRPFVSGADVLAVFDTQCYYHTPSLVKLPDGISHALVNWGDLGLYRAGVAHDTIHLADLGKANLSQYRVVVFHNVYRMSAAQRRFIRERVARDGRHVMWYYAPGYTDGQRNSDSFVREVTGLDLQRVDLGANPRIRVEPSLLKETEYGVVDVAVSPLYAVHDRDAEALGHFAGTQHVAIACKRWATHTTWYTALPAWSSAIYTALVRRTPAHCYCADADAVYAGGGLVAVHTKSGGDKRIVLPGGKIVDLALPPGPATAILDAQTGQNLLD